MNFTSFHFLGFFLVALIFGRLLKNRAQRVFLLLASYYFYGAFEPTYLILILFSTLVDYIAALGIQEKRSPEIQGSWTRRLGLLSGRFWLGLSLTMNLSLLAYFKYTNFGIQILNDLSPLGSSVFSWPAANILLPIGISFYTFQSLSYTIDVYRGSLTARRSIIDFALYVAFFPQLVAGPIVRASTFLKNLDDRLPVGREDIVIGVTRIIVGFFRKLVLSDNLAPLVDPVFANPQHYHAADIWLASIGFGFQVYLDFAGYTDIARGVARLFGFEFKINFLYPMAAGNIKEHWERWHLSLTTWIRDYVYIPLGGSRVGPGRLYLNLFIPWFAVGLWHGASYHFVAWGVWQFIMLAVYRQYAATALREKLMKAGGLGYDVFSRILTMFFLNFGFIWFRAQDMSTAAIMHGREFGIFNLAGFFKTLFGGGTFASAAAFLSAPAGFPNLKIQFGAYAILLGLYFFYEYVMNHLQLEYFWKSENKRKLALYLTFMVFCIIAFSRPDSPAFIYFQF